VLKGLIAIEVTQKIVKDIIPPYKQNKEVVANSTRNQSLTRKVGLSRLPTSSPGEHCFSMLKRS